jgi:hypothetical protein
MLKKVKDPESKRAPVSVITGITGTGEFKFQERKSV